MLPRPHLGKGLAAKVGSKLQAAAPACAAGSNAAHSQARSFAATSWHSLGEFATDDVNGAAFRATKAADAEMSSAISASQMKAAPIDWKNYEDSIAHKDLVSSLKGYHDDQIATLDALLKGGEAHKVQASWDAVYAGCVDSCAKSVEASENIVSNGAKALYISYNNPAITEVSTSEWLDTDQYWASFVEKHHFYHNHLCSVIEDPESKEFEDKMQNDMLSNMKLMDDSLQNKLLYQRPSYEYYHVFHGPLVEHMIFYLAKTGGDARFFPELMPHKWFCEIYDAKFKVLEELQKAKRAAQEASGARVVDHAYTPGADLEHAQGYYAALIAKESAIYESAVGRLMGNYMFLSDAVPVQSAAAAGKLSGGSWFSLGDDVNALFWKPDGDVVPSPTHAALAFKEYLKENKKTLPAAYEAAADGFAEVLESRKSGLGGAWLTAPGESLADAFLRRLKRTDPAYAVYEEYVAELKEKWISATKISAEDAKKKLGEIEKKAKLEVAEADALLYDAMENADAKAEIEKLSKLVEADALGAQFSSKQLLAFDAHGVAISADALKTAMGK